MGTMNAKAGCRPIPTPGVALCALLLGMAAPARAAPATTVALAKQDLTELSLQELLDVQVTSVSKHAEPLRHAAGAVTVVTGEDLRRTGARTLAQALRLVPGLQVQRTNAYSYTVTSRGFSGDKLEVLLDGRSVYSPLTSTVFWDALETSLNDVDRIEVIRGPGATLWGANAVNGVINIVTKHTEDTVGNTLRAGAGKEEKAYAAFRGGSKVGEDGFARFYAKALERDASVQDDGAESFDAHDLAVGGFRSDWTPAADHQLTVSGDFHHGREQTEDPDPDVYARGGDAEFSGTNVLARWTHQLSRDTELSVQGYYDGYRRDIPNVFGEKRDTGDVQGQLRFPLQALRTTVTAGIGYRISHDDTAGLPLLVTFEPPSRTLETYSAFAQGQRGLGDDGELTVGTKLEHNESTGFEVQPSIRLGWALGDSAFTWAAVSRAVRLPNRLDEDVLIFNTRVGTRDFESEKVTAYEWGVRAWTAQDLTVDLTTFFNCYTDLRSIESVPPPFGTFGNDIEADSYGGELAIGWTPVAGVAVRPFYSYLRIDAETAASSTDTTTARNLESASPRHSAGLQLSVNPWPAVTVDGFVRYVGELERQRVDAYTELNFRLGWRALPSLELALVGADLLHDSHAEAGTVPSALNADPGIYEMERAVWLDAVWTWR
jgi:iron complex outermembrane recepter protein